MIQKPNPALLEALKDDPWFQTIDPKTLDTSGLSAGFKPISEDTNDFDVPLVNQKAQTKSAQLHNALLSDPEILEELASKQYRTPEEDEVLKQYDKNPSFTFHTHGYRVAARWDKNSWACVAVSEEDTSERRSFKLGGLTRFDKDAVMSQATQYLVPKKPWRDLSDGELDTISRMASAQALPELIKAAEQYCFWALDRYTDDPDFNPIDSRFQSLYSEAAWYVFIQAHVDLDNAAVEWMKEKLGNRAPTVNALFAVYDLWQRENKRLISSRLFNSEAEPEPESQPSLDDLSDKEIASLRLQSMRMAARR